MRASVDYSGRIEMKLIRTELELESDMVISRFLPDIAHRSAIAECKQLSPDATLVDIFQPLHTGLLSMSAVGRAVEEIRKTGACGVQMLQQKFTSVFNRFYDPLPPHLKGVVRRELGWPRAWTTYYSLMDECAWTAYASRFTGKSLFDARGGTYLEKTDSAIYLRVVRSCADAWLQHIAVDGHCYHSRGELIMANLFHANSHLVRYVPQPELPFSMKKDSQKNMIGDFDVTPIVPCRNSGGCIIEGWGRMADASGDDDPYVQYCLKRRDYKEVRAADYPKPLVSIEMQVLRDQGIDAFIRHVCDVLEEFYGFRLDNTDVETASSHAPHISTWDAERFAKVLHRHGYKTVNSCKQSKDQRIKCIQYWVSQKLKITAQVDAVLAKAQGRMPRARGDWGVLVDRDTVAQYVKRNQLSKPEYERLYGENKLPAGFPNSPRQQWLEEWSWREAKGGVRVEDMIRDYAEARQFLIDWQAENRLLSGKADYQRARRQHDELKRLPAQPFNNKSGGLWNRPSKREYWSDLLGHATAGLVYN